MSCINLDLLGPEIKLSIEGNTKYKSFTGGMITIIFFMMSFVVFSIFGFEVFLKKSPLTTFTKDVKETPLLTFNDSMLFLFTLADIFNVPIPEEDRKFTVFFDYTDVDSDTIKEGKNSLINTKYQFEKCTTERINDSKVMTYLVRPIEAYWCLPKNTSLDLYNTFGLSKSKLFRIM